MIMNRNPIQSLWIGSSLSLMEELCINSYLANEHEFHLYTYNDISNIPYGTVVKDANSIIPEKDFFIDDFGSFASFADQFRFTLLYKLGGWWVDMDTVCLKPFDFESDFVFSSEHIDYYNRCGVVNNTYVKSKPGAKVIKDCLDFMSYRGHEHIHWGELGITLLSRMIFRNGLEQNIKYPEYFCPVSYFHLDLLIGDANFILSENSYSVHWWNEIWRRQGINKNAKFSENSLYEILKSKYLKLV